MLLVPSDCYGLVRLKECQMIGGQTHDQVDVPAEATQMQAEVARLFGRGLKQDEKA